jgi:predicted nucleotide-binding protein
MATNPSDPFSWLPEPKLRASVPDLLKHLPTIPSNPPPELLKRIETTLSQQPTPSAASPIKSLIEKLRDHVALGSRLLNENKVTKASSTSWMFRLKAIVQPMLGGAAPYMKRVEELRRRCASTGIPNEEFSNRVQLTADLVDFLEGAAGNTSGLAISRASRPPATKNVFIIHGQDELNARRLADYLREDEDVNPIVMMARPGMSRPLTDKFEDEASRCFFAFALFTADDLVQSASEQYQQARPNVIYETGWFIGRLGKTRVTLLLQSGAEMHTDLQGVSRIHFDQDVREKCQDIRRELKAVGFTY